MAALYPMLAVSVADDIQPDILFGRATTALWLEIGFGKGEHLVAQAKAHPDIGLIGCEPFLNGMAACVGQIEECGAKNIRLYRGDAQDVLEKLPDASLGRIFVLHPDPWPKARHAKRRIINPGPLALMAQKLKVGGELRIGTDHPIYLAHVLQMMAAQSAFVWQAEKESDWSVRPQDWPETRYEQWSLSEGRPVWYLRYVRRAS